MQSQEQETELHSQVTVQDAGEESSQGVTEKKSSSAAASSKIKATYYLSEDDHSALTHVYIKRLQNKQKTDRSALISEAIRLLYKQEMA